MDILSTVGDVQYRVGYHDAYVGDILSTVEDVQYCGGYHDACGGYHDYRVGCSGPWGYHEYHGVMIPLKWRNSSCILSTSHFMTAILVSAFTVQEKRIYKNQKLRTFEADVAAPSTQTPISLNIYQTQDCKS